MQNKKLRVLALHGWQESGNWMRNKTSKIREALSDIIDIDYVDAPHDDVPKNARSPDLKYSWLKFTLPLKRYERWQESLAYLAEYVDKNGPYDGIMCFSQGGIIGTSIAKLIELHQNNESDFLTQEMEKRRPRESWFPKQKAFKFILLFGCFCPMNERGTSLIPYYDNITFNEPSLHVIGKQDKVISNESSETLVLKFRHAVVHYHTGGHYIPQDEEMISKLRSFIEMVSIKSKL